MLRKPLISCLCITKNKPKLLSRAITCFENQTYINKELLVIYESDDLDTPELIQFLKNPQVRSFRVKSDPKLTLGELRNFAITKSAGEYFCQWDDDDWYHDKRLEYQMNAIEISLKPACVLVNWIMYNAFDGNAYISFTKPWEGSLLCKKSVINDRLQYDSINKGEDTILIQKMITENLIYPVSMPSLYIYIFHGENTWNMSHFNGLCANSQLLSNSTSKIINDILEGKYTTYEASQILSSSILLEDVDYFYSFKKLLLPGFRFAESEIA